jgi:hypothetical protein
LKIGAGGVHEQLWQKMPVERNRRIELRRGHELKANHWVACWLAKNATLTWMRLDAASSPRLRPKSRARSVEKVLGAANANLEEISMRTQLNGTAGPH